MGCPSFSFALVRFGILLGAAILSIWLPGRCQGRSQAAFAKPRAAHDTLTSRSQTAHAPPPKVKTVRFVTSNPLKTREVQALLAEGGLEVPFQIEPLDINLPELQEDPTVISIEKCRLAAQYVQGPVLVEDTSLCFNALHGLPGPYIKHFIDGLGNEGLYKLLAAHEDKSAFAMCNVAFTTGPDDDPVVFCGKSYGHIVEPSERTKGAFGWDPIFRPSGFDVTFAEMSVTEKNRVSHRSLALQQFQAYIRDNVETIMGRLL